MAQPDHITAEYVRSILDYDPLTGVFTWRERPVEMFRDGEHSAEHSCKKWNARYAGTRAGRIDRYETICVLKRRYYSHRIAWLYVTGVWPTNEIDHKDRNPTNNAFDNLREASSSQNKINSCRSSPEKSGLRGVYPSRERWAARIRMNGKQMHIGVYQTKEAAHAAYVAAAEEYYGEFATGVSSPVD